MVTDKELQRLDELAKQAGIPLIIDNAYGLPFPQIIFSGASPFWNNNVIMTMRDGIKLSSDIFFPSLNGKKAPGPFPVVLERTPYDKTASRAHSKGNYFARRGYICVIQDVRGRFKSEGEWYAFADEAEDGHDTVEWQAKQDSSIVKIVTMSGS